MSIVGNSFQNSMTYQILYYFIIGTIVTTAMLLLLLSLNIADEASEINAVGSYYGDF